MDRFHHTSLYQFASPEPSYWEATAGPRQFSAPPLQTAEHADVAIIGGGYTGLSAALHLARDFGVDVRLLEAGPIGWGASGRNGGFCAIGGVKISLKRQLQLFGRDETVRGMRRGPRLAAARAMAVVHDAKRPADLVGDGTAKAAAVQ